MNLKKQLKVNVRTNIKNSVQYAELLLSESDEHPKYSQEKASN
jgi:hypothetical protein